MKVRTLSHPFKNCAVKGPLALTPHLRYARHLALRPQLPLSHQLRLSAKRTEWLLPRQSSYAGLEAVADGKTLDEMGKGNQILAVYLHNNESYTAFFVV